MNETKQEARSTDHSNKSILSRGCVPIMSLEASKSLPPLIGNPEYVPTMNDTDFIQQLESRQWSVIWFAPGACRYSAARQSIPGGISDTKGWTLEQYRELVRKHQGDKIQIVETQEERLTVGLLKNALEKAREMS